MGLTKTKIEYLDATWPIAVGCSKGCSYCWARTRVPPRLRHRCQACGDYTPHFHWERLEDPFKPRESRMIGVALTGDLFDPAFSDHDIQRVINVSCIIKRHTFVFLTKQAPRLARYGPFSEWPENCWVGVSAEDGQETHNRGLWLKQVKAPVRCVSFEPLLGRVPHAILHGVLPSVEWG